MLQTTARWMLGPVQQDKPKSRSARLTKTLLNRRRGISAVPPAEWCLSPLVPLALNRIERGKTTPDFATVRKLVLAMDAAERELAQRGK